MNRPGAQGAKGASPRLQVLLIGNGLLEAEP
jgi:hypothetical protein